MSQIIDMVDVCERCTRQRVQSVKKNAQSLLSPVGIVLYIAKSVFRSAEVAAVSNAAILISKSLSIFNVGIVSVR